jgi:hypothetical protein
MIPPTFLMVETLLLVGIKLEPLATLSFQVGSLPARELPSQIGVLEAVHASVK